MRKTHYSVVREEEEEEEEKRERAIILVAMILVASMSPSIPFYALSKLSWTMEDDEGREPFVSK